MSNLYSKKKTMSYSELDVFKAAIALTNNRDHRSLERELVKTLFDLLSVESIVLLRFITDSATNEVEDYLEVASFAPINTINNLYTLIPNESDTTRVSFDDDLKQCIQKSTTIKSTTSEKRFLYPIITNNRLIALFDLYGYNESPTSNDLIEGFIQIFSNFTAIIDDNEHDTLTGLLNRKTFDFQLMKLLASPSKLTHQTPHISNKRRIDDSDINHWVGILDIDHFKQINDTYGHVFGDEVLLLFANLLKKTFRNNDLLFRYGGEEFVVVLTSTKDSEAFMVFERFRQQLEAYVFPQVGKLTASTGMVKIGNSTQPSSVLEHADKALYYAKEHGRNQIGNYHQLIADGLIKEQDIKSDIEFF